MNLPGNKLACLFTRYHFDSDIVTVRPIYVRPFSCPTCAV
jgi:hypothetical protein